MIAEAHSSSRYGLLALLLALVLAAGVRAAPVFFKQPAGRDIVEYESVARNLHNGHGYRLDLKIYRAVDTPVVHYSGYDRAPLFPLTLALLQYTLPPDWASRLVGPLLFLLTLLLVYDLIRKVSTVGTAFWTTVLLGVHPGLVELSLQPLTEPQLLLFIMLALWGLFRLENPWVAGFGAALAFLTRPSAAAGLIAVGLACLLPPLRRRSPWAIVGFLVIGLAGPALLVWLNRTYEAPLHLLPQAFLLRVLEHGHTSHLMHAGAVETSTWALLSEHLPAAGYRIAKHALYYIQFLASAVRGIGALLLLAPFALWGFRSRGLLVLAVVALGVGFIDLGFYTLVWSTFDPARFTSVFVAMSTLVLIAGTGLAFESLREYSRDDRWHRVPALIGLSLLLFWGSADAFAGYLDWREEVRGGPYRNPTEALWNRPDSSTWAEASPATDGSRSANHAVILTNVPWFAYRVTQTPTALLPWDVTREDVISLINKDRPSSVLLHAADWPATHESGLEDVRWVLNEIGAERVFQAGLIEEWRLP